MQYLTYDVDANGILNVSALEKSSGKSEKITVNNEKGRLSDEEISRMVDEAEKYKADDEEVKKKIESKNEFDSLIYQSKSVLDNQALNDEDKKAVNEKLDELQNWMYENPNAEVSDYESKKQELQQFIMQYSMKTQEPQQESTSAPVVEEPEDGPQIEEID